jgi:hypothetical protein
MCPERTKMKWRSQQNEHRPGNQSVGLAHLPKGDDWPDYAFPGAGSPNPIVRRDDGLWSIGSADNAAGPFASRVFAEAIAAQGEERHASAT